MTTPEETPWRNDDAYVLAAAHAELWARGEPDRELTIEEARAIVAEYRQGYKDLDVDAPSDGVGHNTHGR